jgi:guanine deaminase
MPANAAAQAELVRGPLFHTPANAFRSDTALVSHEDGGLLIRDGRIEASGDFSTVRAAHPDATVTDWRGGFVVPGFVDTHVHFPQLRILGGLGRTLLDWLEHVALPEEARMADVAYATGTARRFVRALTAHGTTTALVFGSHFSPATAALFDAAREAGVRVISGLVVSDRYLRPELHQSPGDAHRDSTALIHRYHRRGRLLYAVTPRFALSASEPMLEMCGALLAEHDGLRVQTHINESLAEIAEVPRFFPWARTIWRSTNGSGLRARTPFWRTTSPDRLRARTSCSRADGDCALPQQQRGARERHLSVAAPRRRRRREWRSAPTSGAAPGSEC